ncbi:MAG: phosphoribosylanthranilate isomerase [Steroidobacteraceae bacterium]
MWIKICGMTTPEAIEAAMAAGADAIGFVLSPSVRRLTVSEAARLAAPARGRVPCVAVTQHPSQPLLDDILAQLRPDVWQSDVRDVETLDVPVSLAVLPVLRAAGRESDVRLPDPLPARVLYEGPRSGTGVACDWTGARVVARRTELILAGGLGEANVAAAIASVAPFGVDVSSGVESAPGIKSPEKILRFVEAARHAARAAEEEVG